MRATIKQDSFGDVTITYFGENIMKRIEISNVAPALIEEAAEYNGEMAAFEAPYPGRHNKVQIVWLPAIKRGGATLVGNGESGATAWFDAESPEGILAQFVNGDEREYWPQFTTIDDALNWLSNILNISLDGAEWVYENTDCPDWDDPQFRRYPFLSDPGINNIPEECIR